MPVLLIVAVAVAVVRSRRRGGLADGPARIARFAAGRLPNDRRDWARAMIAELAHIDGRTRRWRFAAGILRVALFPPTSYRRRTASVAGAGALLVAAATAVAVRQVPTLAVFVAVLGVLLCGMVTGVASRVDRTGRSMAHLLVAALAVAGVAATITSVVRVAVAHPAATADHSAHVYSVLFALVLAGYIAAAVAGPQLGAHTTTAMWWALGGAVVSGTVWLVTALTTLGGPEGTVGYLWLTGATATLAAAIGCAVVTGSSRAGARAGLLTAILAAPVHAALDLTVLLGLRHYTLPSAYDLAAFPHSGYPDIASYVLSDAIDGNLIAGLVYFPIVLYILALIGAAVGTSIHKHTIGPAAATGP